MLQQQIVVVEATLKSSSNTLSSGLHTTLQMYFENPTTLFPTLSSTYMFNSVPQSTWLFTWKKLNGQNYFLWSQSVKMIFEGRHKFDFLIG